MNLSPVASKGPGDGSGWVEEARGCERNLVTVAWAGTLREGILEDVAQQAYERWKIGGKKKRKHSFY